MAYTCSKDPSHQSTDSDYCSICGAKIAGAASNITPAAAAPAAAAADGSEACPDCGIPRRPGARFCEVCRYNFETRTSGGASTITPPAAVPPVDAAPSDVISVPAAGLAPAAMPDIAATLPVSQPAPMGDRYEAVVRVDASLYTDPDPSIPCPVNEPERVFPLDLTESLIGRKSDRQDIHPEIPVTDPGVSHRHAKIYREPDGSLAVLDVGSTNSTFVNGAEALAGVRVPLADGAEITIGCWTRIVVRKISV